MIRLFAVTLVALCWSGRAADVRLEPLQSALVAMRGKPEGTGGPRGAGPQLTVAKHQLRDWVESRLAALPERGDIGDLEHRLNAELRQAALFCDETNAPQACQEGNLLGFLEPLSIRRNSAYLEVQAGLGIECGFDESAYLYSWSGEDWRRIWQSEQNTYTEKEYKPQTLHAVLISPYSRGNDYMVLTLGSQSWCTSAWHDVYYRAFRLGPDLQARPLLEGDQVAYLGTHDPPIQGSITVDDALVEYTVRSIDAGVHSREAIRHYRIKHDQVQRVDPLALRPRDFVDEWLTTDWRETARWSESANRGRMRDWHSKLHKDFVVGEFTYPTMHCPATPDLWQVGVDLSDPPTPATQDPKNIYFLVRWRPPYKFSMVDVGEQPFAPCSEEDREADDEDRTLFPVQEWR